MATVVKTGPADHGRPMTLDEFRRGDYEEGYQYELIDGKLYVSPQPNAPEESGRGLVSNKLSDTPRGDPTSSTTSPARPACSCPAVRQPNDRPSRTWRPTTISRLHLPIRDFAGRTSAPSGRRSVSADDPDKDLVRNVELYFWCRRSRNTGSSTRATIRIDRRMRVHRRHGKRWRILDRRVRRDLHDAPAARTSR